MQNYIESLQNKPDHHKRRIAFGVSAGITAIIFVLWAAVIFPQNTQTIVAQGNVQTSQSQGDSPLTTLQNGVAQAYSGITSLWNESANSIQSVNLDAQYTHIKNQVQDGEIKIVPVSPSSPNNGD